MCKEAMQCSSRSRIQGHEGTSSKAEVVLCFRTCHEGSHEACKDQAMWDSLAMWRQC